MKTPVHVPGFLPPLPRHPLAGFLTSLLRGFPDNPDDGSMPSFQGLGSNVHAMVALAAAQPLSPNDREISMPPHNDAVLRRWLGPTAGLALPYVGTGELFGMFKWSSWIEAVLFLDEKLCRVSRVHPQAKPRARWPKDPSAFNASLLAEIKRSTLDHEWLAALLTAIGCDPWQGPDWFNTEPPPLAVILAICGGHAGLLETFLDHPQAMSAQELLDRYPNVWEPLVSRSRAWPSLQVLLERGLKMLKVDVVETLGIASSKAIHTLAGAETVTISASQIDQLKPKWLQRWSDKDNPEENKHPNTEAIVELLAEALLLPAPTPARQVRHALAFALDLNGAAPEEPLPPAPAAGTWDERCTVSVGPFAGEWNALGVWALLKLQTSLFSEPSPLDEQPRQALACGTDESMIRAWNLAWRPGVPIAGLVLLALMVTTRPSSDSNPQAHNALEGCQAWEGWAQDPVSAMLAVTEALLTPVGNYEGYLRYNPQQAFHRPQAVWWWRHALDQRPCLLDHMGPEQLARLFDAVGFGGYGSRYRFSTFAVLAHRLIPPEDWADPLSLPPGPYRRAALWAQHATVPIATMLAEATKVPWGDQPALRSWFAARVEKESRAGLMFDPDGLVLMERWDQRWEKELQSERLGLRWSGPTVEENPSRL